jgi:hypothetical protein
MKQPKDKRYTLNLEFCGYHTAQLVVRFCGEWLVIATDATNAAEIIAAHHAKIIGL